MGTQTPAGNESGHGPLPSGRGPSVDENEDEDGDEDEEKAGDEFAEIPETKKNAPGPVGVTWSFAQGTDLSEARVSQPEPSKFVLIRINVNNPDQIDVRRYPHIARFDWNDKTQIKALNKSRWQLRRRTTGSVGPSRLPWSEREKQELKRQVQNALDSGQARHAIDWSQIAANMTERFQGMVQRKGEAVARADGTDVTERSYTTLHQDRTGFERPATAVRNQAMRFTDIASLLRASSLAEALSAGKRKRGMEVESEDEDEEDEDDIEDEDFGTGKKGNRHRPLLRRRCSPRSPPLRAPKKPLGPPPPPPDSGTATSAGSRHRLPVTRPVSTN